MASVQDEINELRAERDYLYAVMAAHLASALGSEAESSRICDSPEVEQAADAMNTAAIKRVQRFSADLYALADAAKKKMPL